PSNKAEIDFPRTTNVVWSKVPEETIYILQVESGNATALENVNNYQPLGSYETAETSFTFTGTGYQVHRFKVIAKKDEATLAETPWRYVIYTN
ncbi:MAG: hypothetical protein ICV53_21605, partial [Flavisolibacter sp.]|nr:hypothetical protein [Flavisolibacter sp.]